ncbi:MAG: hypothetical protein KAT11_00210 [Phycisphaerae bacterium]|nr:hypothetical protein [Phycisphaerae bacterium]
MSRNKGKLPSNHSSDTNGKEPVGATTPYKGPNWVFDMMGLPPFWLARAKRLHRAAEIVFQSVQQDVTMTRKHAAALKQDPKAVLSFPEQPLIPEFLLLAALALENLLKGIFVREHPDCISKGRMRGNFVTSHGLVELADKNNILLSDSERTLLSLAESAIADWGRYPIPKNFGELQQSITLSTKIGKVYFDLFCKLAGDLEKNPFQESKKA